MLKVAYIQSVIHQNFGVFGY